MSARWLDPSTMPRALATYALLALVICFFRLGSGGVLLTEGMVAEAGRNMVESGDWWVPQMYGEPYTYKPPMAYWMAALPFVVSEGRPLEAVLRLPFALAAWVMGLALVILIGRQSEPFAGLMAGLAAVGSGAFVQKSHSANFDVLVAAGVGVAVAAACVNLTAERSQPALWLIAYLGLTFAFLTKGALAVMVFGPGLLAAAWVAGRFRRLVAPGHLIAAGLFGVVALGYLIVLGRELGSSGFNQPIEEAQRRALSWSLPAVSGSLAKPFLIWGGLLPWSLLLLPAARMLEPSTRAGNRVLLLSTSFAFLIAGVLAFMLVPTHNMRYYLSLSAPAGIVAGVALSLLRSRGAPPLLIRGSRVLALALAVAALTLATSRPWLAPGDRLLLGAVALLAVASTLLAERAPAGPVATLLLAATLTFVACDGIVLKIEHASKRSLNDLAARLEPLVPPGETLWVRGPADYSGKHASLFFYLDRPVRAFGSPEQLAAGDFYVFAEDLLPESAQSDMAFEVIEVFDDPRYTYKLARRLAIAQPSSALDLGVDR